MLLGTYGVIGWCWYNNLLLKYALWTGTVGAHSVGRCVLYSYRFLDPLIQWNLRQPAWSKPNDVKSLQVEQAKRAEQAGVGAGVWSHWRCHPESMRQSGEHTKRMALMSKWCQNLQRKLDKCMINCDDLLRHFNKMLTNWHWMSSIKK